MSPCRARRARTDSPRRFGERDELVDCRLTARDREAAPRCARPTRCSRPVWSIAARAREFARPRMAGRRDRTALRAPDPRSTGPPRRWRREADVVGDAFRIRGEAGFEVRVDRQIDGGAQPFQCCSTSSRRHVLSARPVVHAYPALVDASAAKPRCWSIRALPTSHGLGMTKQPARGGRERRRACQRCCGSSVVALFCKREVRRSLPALHWKRLVCLPHVQREEGKRGVADVPHEGSRADLNLKFHGRAAVMGMMPVGSTATTQA